MTFDDYQRQARRTQNADLTDEQRLNHALHGLASEVGEIHGIFQKVYQGHKIDDEDLVKELGDLLWFAAEFADAKRWSLGVVAERNLAKLWRRFPAGFDSVRSTHRSEYEEGAK